MRLYPDQNDPMQSLCLLLEDYILSNAPVVSRSSTPKRGQRRSSPARDLSKMAKDSIDGEFVSYRDQYDAEASSLVAKNKKFYEKVFNGYSKMSKRNVKIMPLRMYKIAMRDLGLIPHLTTEYKVG